MRVVVYLLSTFAFVLQLAGAVLVVLDVKQAQDNVTTFKQRLDEANSKKEEHLQQMAAQSGRAVRGWRGGSIHLPTIPEQARGPLADQIGPSSMIERRALTEFVAAQYAISKVRRWSGVGLLFAGLAIGYVASMLSAS
ncbi:hypothetical protein [Rhodococcus sp. ACS1]|uniref:hypothetical protein n=1 Tax=Rhodococcus sp. ACS1 TaxID=2028570 RepID=UPI00117AA840|nr:hypothetical protein [Rhodococcus sp. ACS1]